MILSLDMSSDVPIYVQLRNQIVTGIGKGELKAGESLPSVRQMAQDAGINSMTVNKAYQILKARPAKGRDGTPCPADHRYFPGKIRSRIGASVCRSLSEGYPAGGVFRYL